MAIAVLSFQNVWGLCPNLGHCARKLDAGGLWVCGLFRTSAIVLTRVKYDVAFPSLSSSVVKHPNWWVPFSEPGFGVVAAGSRAGSLRREPRRV